MSDFMIWFSALRFSFHHENNKKTQSFFFLLCNFTSLIFCHQNIVSLERYQFTSFLFVKCSQNVTFLSCHKYVTQTKPKKKNGEMDGDCFINDALYPYLIRWKHNIQFVSEEKRKTYLLKTREKENLIQINSSAF